MATVHPSRLGLVPQDANPRTDSRRSTEAREGDSYSRRRNSRERNDRDTRRDYDRDSRDRRRDRSRSRERNERNNGRERDAGDRPRRASPDYSAYRRDEPPHVSSSAQRSGDMGPPPTMYPPRGERRADVGPAAGRDSGSDFLMGRRKQREAMDFSIWPSSPVHSRESSPTRKSKRRRSDKKRRSPSVTDSSEEERERKRKKDKKRKDKGKDRDEGRDKGSRKHRRDKSYDNESDDDRRQRQRRSRSYRTDGSEDDRQKKRRSPTRHESEDDRGRRSESAHSGKGKDERHNSQHRSRANTPPRSPTAEDEDMWVEKEPEAFVAIAEHAKGPPGAEPRLTANSGEQKTATALDEEEEEEDADDVGPQPAPAANLAKKVDEREYGGALLRGEGSAMAAFLLEGGTDARIPRRGEIGLTPDEIATFESVGYVMSGSRHRRMNAVRMRKENQVISAEEKRGILKLQKEERERREAILRDEFRELVEEKLKTAGAGPRPPS